MILNLLGENPNITQINIAKELNLTRKQVQVVIKALQDENILEREGSNRSGRWIVKG
ncbi:MAG: winged helix-turn-helix transcriptional regulator [Clostridium sp.]|nr:winged helix-turn-helix transcriptional regulator [Clostridium sp.]